MRFGTLSVSSSLSWLGASEIPHLDRGADRLEQNLLLQLEWQGTDRHFGIAKVFPRLRPLALLGEGERTPDRGIVLIADDRVGEILEGGLAAAEHDVGD